MLLNMLNEIFLHIIFSIKWLKLLKKLADCCINEISNHASDKFSSKRVIYYSLYSTYSYWSILAVKYSNFDCFHRTYILFCILTIITKRFIIVLLMACTLLNTAIQPCGFCNAVLCIASCSHRKSLQGSFSDGWMDERCFRPLFCTIKTELGRGQPGLMRWSWDETLPQCSIDRSTFYTAAHSATSGLAAAPAAFLNWAQWHQFWFQFRCNFLPSTVCRCRKVWWLTIGFSPYHCLIMHSH